MTNRRLIISTAGSLTRQETLVRFRAWGWRTIVAGRICLPVFRRPETGALCAC